MDNFLTTSKGTKLPLLNLKGKPYLMGAYRLVWLNEEHSNFTISTEFLLINDDQTVAKSTVTIFDNEGKVIKQASATKREHKAHFADHTEKAESGSIFRALSMLGMGTQFSIADLDEGTRLADTPVEPPKKSTFRKPPVGDEVTTPPTNGSGVSDGWE